jgi:hypothetical protein
MKRTRLLILSGKIIKFLLFPLIAFQALIFVALAEESSSIWGQVFDKNQNPFPGVRIVITSKESEFQKNLVSDASGFFKLGGFPSGLYSIHCRAKKGFLLSLGALFT